MFEQLCGWIQDISVYLIAAAAVMHAVPGGEYKKYIRFFSGIIFLLLVLTPVLKLTGMEQDFLEVWREGEYEIRKHEIAEAEEMLGNGNSFDFLPEADLQETEEQSGDEKTEPGRIRVEVIRIGQ